MTPRALSILDGELLKVRRRWLPYILLTVLILIVGMQVWLGGYVSWRTADELEFERESLRLFVLPYALPGVLETAQFWGAIFTGIIAASMVATEHAWGTVRQALIRGQSRADYLTMKLAGVAAVGIAGFAVATLAGLLFVVLASSLADQPISFDAPGGPSFLEVVLMVLRAVYAMVPYVLLAFCLTVISRSTTLGVAGILVFVIVEGIVVGVLGGIGGRTADYRILFLGHNVAAVVAASRIGGEATDSLAFRDAPESSELPDPFAAALIVAIYCALFLALSYRVFLRRDLGVESGGN